MKKLLIGATIALSVLLPLGVAYAAPPNNPDPNPDNGQDCEDHGNNGGGNAPHCTTTTVTGPPTTTTQPPGDPCDDDEIVDLDNCQTTTTQPPNPCDDEIVDQDNCPTTTVAPTCPGRVRLGNWYADPQINIFLRGKGTFRVTGGIQRFSGQRTIVATLDCGEKLKVPHYKVKSGHALKVYKDGKLVINQVPPRLN